jgi:hypothetical protein
MKLLYLRASNGAVLVEEKPPTGVKVDAEKKVWALERNPDRTFQIGESRRMSDGDEGVIGVFDAGNVEHVKSMVSATWGYMHHRSFHGASFDD